MIIHHQALTTSVWYLYNRLETAQAAAGLRRVTDGHGGGGNWQTIMFPFNTQGMTGAQMIDRKMELREAHKKVLWEMNRALAELYTEPDKEQLSPDIEVCSSHIQTHY